MKRIAIVIVVVGLLIAVVTGFGFITNEKVVDMGSIEITANKKHEVEWSPILGMVVAAAGAGLWLHAARERS